MLDRRAFLIASLAASTLLARAGSAVAAMAGSVKVDVSRLRAQGVGPNADYIKAGLERELAGAAAPGTSLVVTVRGIFMASYAGGASMFGGGAADDRIDSEVTVTGPDGRIIASYPVLSSSSPSAAGPWYAPNIDRLRLDVMIRTNASWVRRYAGA